MADPQGMAVALLAGCTVTHCQGVVEVTLSAGLPNQQQPIKSAGPTPSLSWQLWSPLLSNSCFTSNQPKQPAGTDTSTAQDFTAHHSAQHSALHFAQKVGCTGPPPGPQKHCGTPTCTQIKHKRIQVLCQIAPPPPWAVHDAIVDWQSIPRGVKGCNTIYWVLLTPYPLTPPFKASCSSLLLRLGPRLVPSSKPWAPGWAPAGTCFSPTSVGY